MNFNQILIRLGVDATAVTTGLGRIGASVKGWFAGLQHDLASHFGRMIVSTMGIVGAERMFEKISEKILAVRHASEQLGASTNFVQGLMSAATKAGLDYEKINRPLVAFSTLIGEAKDGSAAAREKLIDLGIATKDTEWRTLNFSTALQRLQVRYKELNAEQRNSLLASVGMGGRNAFAANAMLGGGSVADFEKGNFFTKISESTITDWTMISQTMRASGGKMVATLANAAMLVERYSPVAFMARLAGAQAGGGTSSLENLKMVATGNFKDAEEAHKLELESIDAQKTKSDILAAQNNLLEKQKELTANIADRGKSSLADLAEQARRLTGARRPQQYAVTERMRAALKIQTLEEQANIEWMRGNDAGMAALNAEALNLRQANPWLKLADQDPQAKTVAELQSVNLKLEPVQRMAEMVNKDAAAHGPGTH